MINHISLFIKEATIKKFKSAEKKRNLSRNKKGVKHT